MNITMKLILSLLLLWICAPVLAQQFADTLYQPAITNPAYHEGDGPLVCIDEGHQNFHTREGRYRPFAEVVQRDGFRVASYSGEFIMDNLNACDILVIANALSQQNLGKWFRPVYSAFTEEEVETVHDWVQEGGRLFLIADHMPMAGAASELAKAFGYGFNDGFALVPAKNGPDYFTLENGLLVAGDLTRYDAHALDSIMTFTGQAFSIPENATPVLKLGKDWISLQPDTAWQFHPSTPRIAADTLYQGAYQEYGNGKLVVFGEAAMFSAQLSKTANGTFKMGMNRPGAENNYKLLLSILRWLDPGP